MAEDKKMGACPHCGSANCNCKSGNCPFGKTDKIACLILKVVKIIVFIALAFVLFDIHSMLSHAERNMNAAAAAQAAMMQPGPSQGAVSQ